MYVSSKVVCMIHAAEKQIQERVYTLTAYVSSLDAYISASSCAV